MYIPKINYIYYHSRTGEPKQNTLHLRPSQSSILNRGDSIEVECISTEGGEIHWEAADGTRLPYNFRQDNSRLIIENVQLQNQGTYVCKCENDGQVYQQEYELNVESDNNVELLKPKVEYADVGSNVVLKCNSDRGYSTRYQWTRPIGQLPEGQDYTYVSSFQFIMKLIFNIYLLFYSMNYDSHQYKLRMLALTFVQHHTVAKLYKFQQF